MKSYRRVAEAQNQAELGTNGEMECRSFGVLGAKAARKRRARSDAPYHRKARHASPPGRRPAFRRQRDIGLLDRGGRNAHFCCGFWDIFWCMVRRRMIL
jgi:hypothetical protein